MCELAFSHLPPALSYNKNVDILRCENSSSGIWDDVVGSLLTSNKKPKNWIFNLPGF